MTCTTASTERQSSAALISVLMPMKAFSDYTLTAVNSVLNQTYSDWELIVVGQADICDVMSQLPDDRRIRGFARLAPGIVGALNTGLAHCSGDYIARMDADDICTPERLETQLAFAKRHRKIGLVGARVQFFDDTQAIGAGNERYACWLNGLCSTTEIHDACLIESPVPHPTFFAHRDIWQAIGPYRDCSWPEDYDFILRAWLLGIGMGKPDPILLKWREHANRLTRTHSRYRREAFIKAKAWAIAQPMSPVNIKRGIWICGTGRNSRYWHDALKDVGAQVQGFVELDTRTSKTSKRGLPVIDYDTLAQRWGDELVVSALGNDTARVALIKWFTKMGRSSCVDYVIGA